MRDLEINYFKTMFKFPPILSKTSVFLFFQVSGRIPHRSLRVNNMKNRGIYKVQVLWQSAPEVQVMAGVPVDLVRPFPYSPEVYVRVSRQQPPFCRDQIHGISPARAQ
ncbi:uncharacterized protein LOC112127075 [Cimex lectularius]|uniref:Uncharacterized protein n=1 Tax=Cimex lectularius TaxID=79782 RepID=A0A8I6SKZ0_CIMLE|nr:uncharacterized protein LOC112127075 [Cimex lectularius]